ncbi:MAG TPA: hypothetical protein VFB78_19215 [Acidimicrobiales bacterium]|nr:hypothetical protein [Acidimicrobiales bacterium]
MAAFIASWVILAIMVGVLLLVARRRAPGTPLTWGEAFVAAVYVFALLFIAYGVVPHQFLALADNSFKWRDDKIGIPLGGLKIAGHHLLGMKPPYLLFPKGIPLPGGHGYFIVTAQVLRDVIVGGLYGVLVGAQLYGWAWWQKRGKQAAGTEIETSAFGRPLLRPVSGES